MKEKPLVNRVANSALKVINLEDYFPASEVLSFDLKDYLFKGLILREKEFRKEMKAMDWDAYADKHVALHCSADAIVPTWAFMLVGCYLKGAGAYVSYTAPEDYLDHYYSKVLSTFEWKEYEGERVVVKGCSDKPVPVSAYVTAVEGLQPYAQSIMYGEPCSTVPLFKRPRKL